jgi:tellurium resistance protein TerD
MIVISINNIEDGVHFGNVLNPSVRIYNQSNGSVLCEFNLTEKYDRCDSLIIGRFYRNGAEWEFEALGLAFEGELGATVEFYN